MTFGLLNWIVLGAFLAGTTVVGHRLRGDTSRLERALFFVGVVLSQAVRLLGAKREALIVAGARSVCERQYVPLRIAAHSIS